MQHRILYSFTMKSVKAVIASTILQFFAGTLSESHGPAPCHSLLKGHCDSGVCGLVLSGVAERFVIPCGTRMRGACTVSNL